MRNIRTDGVGVKFRDEKRIAGRFKNPGIAFARTLYRVRRDARLVFQERSLGSANKYYFTVPVV